MGSLANQYISQSYTSLIHLGNDTTASANLVELQDGLGNGLGISVNTQGDISASNSVTTLDLFVTNDTELSGAFNLNTYFTASTPAYINSTQPYFTDTIYVTGSYPSGNYPPSIADVEVGWICNGINVTNGVVTAVSKSVNEYWITIGGQSPQSLQPYTFTGRISPNAHIYGGLEVSENLIVSGTFDIEGKVVVNDNVRVNGNLEVSGSQRNTGSLFVSNEISSSTINGIGNVTAFSQSLWAEFTNIENYTSSLRTAFTASGVDTIFTNNITASNIEVRSDLNVGGTLYASKVVTLIESASIIYSSGSNILGDETSDTQTLIGSVIMSGSGALTGSMGISANLDVKGNISSSTISGIGNVTSYSQSVDARLDIVEATASLYIPFSTSVNSRLVAVETTASFLNGPFSQSVDNRLDELENWSSSLQTDFVTEIQLTQTASFLQNQINQKLFTSSFNAYTSSISNTITTLVTTASFNSYTQSTDSRINTLSSFTGSYATTGSNAFVGNQIVSGSLRGRVVPITISANTASMDCSLGNFFTLTLQSSVNTRLVATNILPGETISLRVTQPATPGTISYPSNFKFPNFGIYSASVISNAEDIVTFISFDSTNLYGVNVKNMI